MYVSASKLSERRIRRATRRCTLTIATLGPAALAFALAGERRDVLRTCLLFSCENEDGLPSAGGAGTLLAWHSLSQIRHRASTISRRPRSLPTFDGSGLRSSRLRTPSRSPTRNARSCNVDSRLIVPTRKPRARGTRPWHEVRQELFAKWSSPDDATS